MSDFLLFAFQILLPLAVMIFLIWNRINIVVSAVIAVILVSLFSGINPLTCISTDFMTKYGSYVISFFPLILCGALFSAAMSQSGASTDVANFLTAKFGQKSILVLLTLICFVLTYGGVSYLVVTFAVYPIALQMFRRADLPRHLIVACICVGAFAMPTLLPGSTHMCNLMPSGPLGTSPNCAPLLSFIITGTITVLGFAYIFWQAKLARKRGEGFTDDPRAIANPAAEREPGNGYKALAPMVVVVACILLDISPLIAMVIGVILVYILFWKQIPNKKKILDQGVSDGGAAVIATSAVVGFGGVAAVTPAFQSILNLATGLNGPPELSYILGCGIMGLASGSGSGGIALTLQYLAPKYLAMGVAPVVLHKLCSIACCTLDSLPHNGVMVTTLSVCGMTHKEAYKHMFAVTVVIHTIASIVGAFAAMLLY